MPTVSRGLPQRPHIEVPKRQARELLQQCRAHQEDAFERIRRRHPRLQKADSATISATFKLNDAQLVIAREYGFSNWSELKERITANTAAGLIHQAIRGNDAQTVTRLLRANPNLLHIPLVSGNWGPPMSHAANLGLLEMVKSIAALGARDFQHAFGRALLQGKLEVARWLHDQGVELEPGIIMGCCETLNVDGFAFLDDLKVPFVDGRDNPLTPLALVLETYCRNPARKHSILERFARRGYKFPDTPIMAFHRGDVNRLKEHLRQTPNLIHRTFAYREIYPPELGCADDGRSGMHGTPIDGTTLLHLAIDFDEQEVFDLLLDQGADVNARATVDQEGFGGHTPLFNAVVSDAYTCGRQRDAAMARTLLERGASPLIRVNLRKFLDWRDEPGWHTAYNVSPAEWGRGFPEKNWVNREALRLLDGTINSHP